MENLKLTIGTKVSYTQTHIHSEPTQHESTIKGFLPEGWVLLENGDTFTKSALNIVTESNDDLTTIEKVKRIEELLKECNENARYKFKVRRTKETYVNSKLYCLTVVGRTHVSLLEDAVEKATNEFWKLGGSQIHHTAQHNLKIWFAQ